MPNIRDPIRDPVPLIAFAVAAYVAGLFVGFGAETVWPTVAAAALPVVMLLLRRSLPMVACALIFAVGETVAVDAVAPPPSVGQGDRRAAEDVGVLERWRERAGFSIDSLFGSDAPVVRALLVADTRQLPVELRDRYSRAGLVHLLSISGLHVAIISGAVLLALQMARCRRTVARWLGVALTALYVIAIGAPPPALRSGAMLAADTIAWGLQRHVSPWATLAIGAAIPVLLDPRTVLDLGYQLSVTGFAALIAGRLWAQRLLRSDVERIRRKLASDFLVSAVASFASAPLVAWHFARISLIAPFTNLLAAPVVALMQPALFLALVLAPLGEPAALVADGARVFVRALDAIALAGSRVPGASVVVAPSLAVTWLAGAMTICVIGAVAARRNRGQWAVGGIACLAAMVWWPVIPRTSRGMELHMIDVGQADAIAIRTPRGKWIVVDAGGGRMAGGSGQRVVLPYLRRLGGDVALFVMTHPHEDHVGGAAALITQLAPAEVRDAAFAGTSPSYREALVAARTRGVVWNRIRPGDSVTVDGVVTTFLAPDSAWTAGLGDPNLASAVMRVRYGDVRILLTGDAEAAEEEWILRHHAAMLRAEVLKVAHHGSATSTSATFLQAVRPDIALISVGRGNRYGHPSPGVAQALADVGAVVLRTDQRGTVVLRTDPAGTHIVVADAR